MLGQRISILRRGLGWSQAELARQLHCSSSAVGMYEQGRREPSLEAVVAMAEAFGVTVDFLLTGKPITTWDQKSLEQSVDRAVQQTLGSRRQSLDGPQLTALLAAVLTEG